MLHTPNSCHFRIAAAICWSHGRHLTATIANANRFTVCPMLAEIERENATIQSANRQAIQFTSLVIEFDVTDALSYICLPSHCHRPQIEHLYITVVVASTNASFARIECIAERHSPAILPSDPALAFFQWHETCHRTVFLPGIPDFDTAILAARDDFQSSATTAATNGIDSVDYSLMGSVIFEHKTIQSFDIPVVGTLHVN